jgi:hypothetical protein
MELVPLFQPEIVPSSVSKMKDAGLVPTKNPVVEFCICPVTLAGWDAPGAVAIVTTTVLTSPSVV